MITTATLITVVTMVTMVTGLYTMNGREKYLQAHFLQLAKNS